VCVNLSVYIFFLCRCVYYTGIFISPSAISEVDCRTTERSTAERRISTERGTPSFCHTLQVLDMCTLGDTADVNPVIKFLRHALQHLAVDSSECLRRLCKRKRHKTHSL